ncbi:MAG: lipoprotein-releasing ABC transporter permease subunit [candidate division Zixibacteria bacterium]|nr:lipoprotein-releasing ABC transporter permease subunit [candidate division Zixibacteria bacterium]
MSYELFIAKRYLKSKKRSGFLSVFTLISILGVLIGVAALIFVLSMMNGFEKEVRSRIIGNTAHINVYPIEREGIEDYSDLISKIEKVKHVVAATPVITYKAAIASKSSGDGIVVRGIDAARETTVTTIGQNMLDGNLNFQTQTDYPGIVLGAGLAGRLGVGIGDHVILFSLKEKSISSGWVVPKASKFIVTGIFETGLYEYDISLAYVSLESAQRLFNLENRVTNIQVKVDNLYKAGKTAREVENAVGYRFYAQDWMNMNKSLFSWMALEKYAMFIVLSLIVAVAAFNIVSTLIMTVLDKKKDIGVLKSMGATQNSIMKIFMFKGLIVGIIGTVLGSALGYLLCWVQKTFKVVSLPAEIYFINSLPIDMRVSDFTLVVVAALGITFLATIYPARQAAGLDPVEAIRYE